MYKQLGFAPVVLAAAGASGPAAPVTIAIAVAGTALMYVISQIGKGRKEADAIVPTQNKVMDVVAKMIPAIPQAQSVAQLQEWYGQIAKMGLDFVTFTHDPGFPDGRAGHQARVTVMPYIDGSDGEGHEDLSKGGGLLNAISQQILRFTGAPMPPPTVTQGGLPQLRYPSTQQIPQSGLLNPQPEPAWTLAPEYNVQSAGIGGMDSNTLLLVVIGLASFAMLRR